MSHLDLFPSIFLTAPSVRDRVSASAPSSPSSETFPTSPCPPRRRRVSFSFFQRRKPPRPKYGPDFEDFSQFKLKNHFLVSGWDSPMCLDDTKPSIIITSDEQTSPRQNASKPSPPSLSLILPTIDILPPPTSQLQIEVPPHAPFYTGDDGNLLADSFIICGVSPDDEPFTFPLPPKTSPPLRARLTSSATTRALRRRNTAISGYFTPFEIEQRRFSLDDNDIYELGCGDGGDCDEEDWRRVIDTLFISDISRLSVASDMTDDTY